MDVLPSMHVKIQENELINVYWTNDFKKLKIIDLHFGFSNTLDIITYEHIASQITKT